MLNFVRMFLLAVAVSVSACGGGGGSAGSTLNVGALRSTAGSIVTLAVGVTQQYEVSGGVAPYQFAGSTAPQIASATVSGNVLTIQTLAAGSAILTVTDKGGSQISVSVTAGSSVALTTTAPESLKVPLGASVGGYLVTGGRPPYVATSSDISVVQAQVSVDSKLSLSGVKAGTASVTISDADSQKINITVNVNSSSPLVTTVPDAVTVPLGSTIGGYAVSGGRAPYVATSSDIGIAQVLISADNKLSLTGVNIGATSVIISDADFQKLTIGVAVGASAPLFFQGPSTLTLVAGDTSEPYLISGGKVPYRVASSKPAVATATIAGTVLRVTALTVGETELRVVDDSGKFFTLGVTVEASAFSGTVSADPQLRSAGLKDGNGTSTSSIGASGYTTLQVTLTDPSGRPIPNQLIEVSDTGTVPKVTFPEGPSALTNSNGVASIKVARVSLTALGAGSLTVTYSYKAGTLTNYYPGGFVPPTVDKVISTYVGYQLATANVTLSNLNVGAFALEAYGTRQVSVQANLNGLPTPTPVQINFSANCGVISPATTSTNNSGVATVSYSATDLAGSTPSTQGCSGKTVEISASTAGAAALTQTLTITSAAATNMSFVDATPARIYLANSGGPTQSIVRFKLINARGEAMLGQDVVLSLKTTNGGVPKASFGTVGNISPLTLVTDSAGLVSVPVFSGTVPTNVMVNASLKSIPTVQTDSAVLAIASGRPAQARVSLSIEKLSIEGANVDGDESKVTLSLADRQGNPVPDGTAVNFVTSGGVMIPPVCTTGVVPGDSQCTVSIRTQNPRLDVPRVDKAGYVKILAYVAGEEDFVDANFNNVYDAGEAFTDLTTAFRDDNGNQAHDIGEFSVPRLGASTTSGDGGWGAADVRMQSTIVFATSAAVFSNESATVSSARVTIADVNGNSMPTGSVVTAKGIDGVNHFNVFVSSCDVAVGSPVIISNTLSPTVVSFALSSCTSGDSVRVSVATPKTSTVTAYTISIP